MPLRRCQCLDHSAKAMEIFMKNTYVCYLDSDFPFSRQNRSMYAASLSPGRKYLHCIPSIHDTSWMVRSL